MADSRIFLDWNAGAPLRAEARAAMISAMPLTGNPSSVHAEGRAARQIVEDARSRLATLLGTEPANIVFTSGATEAANMALDPETSRPRGVGPLARLVIGASEHPAVLQGHRFAVDRVETAAIDANGLVDIPALVARVTRLTAEHGSGSVMVAVQAANNETGVLQPIGAIKQAVAESGAPLVVDAAQLAGKASLGEVAKHADLTVLSGHKLGGPKGVGALVQRANMRAAPLLRGGGQEFRRRAGTENVAAIAGFAAAAEAAWQEAESFAARAAALQSDLETNLLQITPDAVIYARHAPRLANTTLVSVPGVAAEILVMGLDLAGAAVSSGAACSSGKVGASHVLAAMGVGSFEARSAIRISFGWETTAEDLHRFGDIWRRVVSQIRKNGVIKAA